MSKQTNVNGVERDRAHFAMRDLWMAVDARLRLEDASVSSYAGVVIRSVVLGEAVMIEREGDNVSISAGYETLRGESETVEVQFPADIRDLSEAIVTIKRHDYENASTKTPKLREYPRIARELLDLI